jgi:UDP-N-acetylglucosamine acyltransferase
MVRKSVPPFAKAAREPISYAGVNSVGLIRRGFTEEQVKQIQDIYRILYIKTNNTTQALLEIETNIDVTKERDQILDFIKDADQGIMRGLRSSKNK